MYKICIVDDEYLIREGLKQIIPWESQEIEFAGEASNGIAALELIDRVQPDILLTDVKMPVMGGLDLILETKRRHAKMKVIIISGYDEFDYVKSALTYGVENYLLKPIDETELLETLSSTVEKIDFERHTVTYDKGNRYIIRDNLLLRLLTNRVESDEVADKFNMLGIGLEANYYTVAAIHAAGNGSGGNAGAIEEIWEQSHCGIPYFSLSDTSGNVILIFRHDTMRELTDIRQALSDFIGEEAAGATDRLVVTLGSTQRQLSLLHRSYESAVKLQSYQFFCPPHCMISEEFVSDGNRIPFTVDLDALNELVGLRRREDIETFFGQLRNDIAGCKGISLEEVYVLSAEVLACYFHILRSFGFSYEEIMGFCSYSLEQLFKASSLDETMELLKNTAFHTMDLCSQQAGNDLFTIRRIIRYVDENFMKDISLKTISNEFGISAAYLGQQFKKETGQYFTDYLHLARIGRAKQMLETSSLKANEIAGRLGYANSNYFYKLFKKYTGHSFSQFANHHEVQPTCPLAEWEG